jgi:hypothetical protein
MNTITETNSERQSLTSKEFRQLTQWSVYKMARVSSIPEKTIYAYLKDSADPYYREPKPYINRLFALIYQVKFHGV